MKKKALAVAIIGCSSLLTACNTTLQTTWDKTKTFAEDHKGLLVGCLSGAVVGYAAEAEKGALIGAAAGCAIGYYYDHQRKQMKVVAEESGMDVAFQEVDVKVAEGDKGQLTNNKLLSSSFATKASMFKTGSATPSAEVQALAKKLAVNYKENGTTVMVVGHSDSSGSAAGNQRLSERRAKQVATLLQKAGVPKDRIYYQGVGESQPLAPNSTDEGRSLNRRVEFVEIGSAAALNLQNAQNQQKAKEEQKTVEAQPEVVIPKVVADASFQKYAQVQSTQLRNVAYRDESKQKSMSSAPIDFGGEIAESGTSPLVEYLGEPEKPLFSFSMFSNAYASVEDIGRLYSCVNTEPTRSGAVKSLASGDLPKQSEYVVGMNGSSWTSAVNGNLVAITDLGVLKDDLQVTDSAHVKFYKGTAKDSTLFYDSSKVHAETYDGDKNFLYRVYFSDSKSPASCIDIVMPKSNYLKQHAGEAIAGRIYYNNDGKSMSAKYRPTKVKVQG